MQAKGGREGETRNEGVEVEWVSEEREREEPQAPDRVLH